MGLRRVVAIEPEGRATPELKVSFFAPVRPGMVVAEGWGERLGRKTGFTRGSSRDPAESRWPRDRTIIMTDRVRLEATLREARK